MARFPSSFLHQSKLFHGKSSFEIKAGSHVCVEQSKKTGFVIDLMALSPDSRVQLNIAWHWMIAMAISLVIVVIVLVISDFITEKVIIEYLQYFLVILVSLFFIFSILFYVFSSRKRIFMTRHAKLPIIEILISNPNKNSYNLFIDGLENEIIIAAENRRLNKKQQRAGELKTLRRLSEQGVISKNVYESCKYTLLNA